MSGSRYRPFDYATFAGWMQEIGFAEVNLARTWEYCWERPVTCRLSNGRYAVRVYSSVSKIDNVSRESGGDAIRVLLMDTTRDKPVLNYQVNRTEGAHNNTVRRAREAYGYVSQDASHHCSCGGLMVLRKGSKGQFLGLFVIPCLQTDPAGGGMMKKTLSDLLAQHPDKIDEVGDESRNRDGYWLYLKTGWQSAPHTAVHCVHEWNMRDLKLAMRDVCPCECFACQGLPEPKIGFDGLPIRD